MNGKKIRPINKDTEVTSEMLDNISDLFTNYWIMANEHLPEENRYVLVAYKSYGNDTSLEIAKLKRGRTKEMIDKYSSIYQEDEYGNNKRPYAWFSVNGIHTIFGQDVIEWMPLPNITYEIRNFDMYKYYSIEKIKITNEDMFND